MTTKRQKLVSMQSKGAHIVKVWEKDGSYRIESRTLLSSGEHRSMMLPQIFYSERPAIHFAGNCLTGVA